MYTKQEIIIQSHREGKSQRKIARELQISRKTVSKYLFDYESHLRGSPYEKASLIGYLSKSLVYQSDSRGKLRLTRDIQATIDKMVEENKHKLRHGLRKQVHPCLGADAAEIAGEY